MHALANKVLAPVCRWALAAAGVMLLLAGADPNGGIGVNTSQLAAGSAILLTMLIFGFALGLVRPR